MVAGSDDRRGLGNVSVHGCAEPDCGFLGPGSQPGKADMSRLEMS